MPLSPRCAPPVPSEFSVVWIDFFFELFRGTIEFQFAPEGFDRLSDVAG